MNRSERWGGRWMVRSMGLLLLIMLSAGCEGRRNPDLIYGTLVSVDSNCQAILKFRHRVTLPLRGALRFQPAPDCDYETVQGRSPGEIRILFASASPFKGRQDLKVSVNHGAWRPLVRGGGFPVLRSVTWLDRNDDHGVDGGDQLLLRFSEPITAKGGDDGIPESAFVLTGGSTVLEARLGHADGRVPFSPGPDGQSVLLDMGPDVFLRPGPEGHELTTLFALNASDAAPSTWFSGKESALGAVSRQALPVKPYPSHAGFTLKGRVALGPMGGNIGSSVTFCKTPSTEMGPLVVIAGGRNPDPNDLKPASDVFIFHGEAPKPLVWEGHLKRARASHVAVALPVPPASGLLGMVLFIGGFGPSWRPVRELELLTIRAPRSPAQAAPETDVRILSFPGSGSGQAGALLPRADAKAVYVPEGEGRGIVFITGGEISATGEGFVECFRVQWDAAAASLYVADYSGPLGQLSEHINRVQHSLTALTLPDGTPGVLLFGGQLKNIGLSVAMPYLFFPRDALQGRPTWFERLWVDENEFMRQSHGALFLPDQRKVFIVGGDVNLAGDSKWATHGQFSRYVVEFDVATRLFAKIKNAVTDYRVQPLLLPWPDMNGLLVLGGRSMDNTLVSAVDIFLPEGAGGGGSGKSGFYSFTALLPEELAGARNMFLNAAHCHDTLYLAGGRQCTVWAFVR